MILIKPQNAHAYLKQRQNNYGRRDFFFLIKFSNLNRNVKNERIEGRRLKKGRGDTEK